MKPYRILEEHPDHMVLHIEGEKSPMKVAISNRHYGTVERIRKFAKGGGVPHAAFGLDVPEGYDPTLGAPVNQQSISDEQLQAGLESIVGPFSDQAQAARAGRADLPSGGVPPGAARPAGALSDGTPAPVIPAAAVAPQAISGLGGGGGAASQIAAAGREASQALGQVGTAQAQGYQNIANVGQQGMATEEAMRQQAQVMLTERMARQEQMFNDISAQRIDPQHLWQSKTTGQKIGSVISILLSGLGAGRGPNFALDQIDKATERDIDAQKANLQNKHSILGQYMQQTRDLQAAEHLLRADYLTNVAGQIQVATARMQGAAALPQMQATMAELKAKTASEVQAAIARTQQIQITNMQMQYQQGLIKNLMGGPGGTPARNMLLGSFLQHPEKLSEHQVDAMQDVPTGAVDQDGQPLMKMQTTPYLGKSPQIAEKAGEALHKNYLVDKSVTELENFARSNPLGGAPGSGAVGRARSAMKNIKLNYESMLSSMNRQPSPEVAKELDDIVRDPTLLLKSGKQAGSLQYLREMVNAHKQVTLHTSTLGPLR